MNELKIDFDERNSMLLKRIMCLIAKPNGTVLWRYDEPRHSVNIMIIVAVILKRSAAVS